MIYRVAFSKRFQSDGNESGLDPTSELDVNLPDGVVAEKVFVSRFEPEAKHSQEVLDEDDAFLGMSAAELWDYNVLDERASEFEEAVANSETVIEFEVTDDTPTDEEDLPSDVALAQGGQPGSVRQRRRGPGGAHRTGSGVRGSDDGPAGQPTVDTSAGAMSSDGVLQLDEVEGIGSEGSGIDDLTIVREDDPSLGLTAHGKRGPEDWAADTGPDREPDRGIATDDMEDDASTLAPDRGR